MDSVTPKEIKYNHNYEAQFVRGIERRYEGQNTLTQPKACFIAKATRCTNILSKRLTYLCNYFSIFENDAVKHCNDVSERSGIQNILGQLNIPVCSWIKLKARYFELSILMSR